MAPSNLLFDLEKTGNFIEAGFWIVFGVGLAIAGTRRGRAIAHLGLLSGTILCLFGVSDLVEASYGCLVASLVAAGLERYLPRRHGALRLEVSPNLGA